MSIFQGPHENKGIGGGDYLDTFGVHFVVFVGIGPVQPRIPFLANKQVRIIHLLKLQLDRINKLSTHKVGSFIPQRHTSRHVGWTKEDHDGVGVSVDYGGIVFVPVRFGVPLFDEFAGFFDHLAAVGGCGGGYGETG